MDGLYLLWWVQEKQMSPALVAATMAAGDLLLMALEVPTGWFADRFGNRRSLILGSVLQVAGMICCWLAEGIPGLVGACLLPTPSVRAPTSRCSIARASRSAANLSSSASKHALAPCRSSCWRA
jgi:MFS family permease